MTDNGLAALAAALSAAAHDDGRHYWCKDRNDCGLYGYAEEFAAAILGERGVFLPDGLEEYRELIRQYQAEIATLRVALDGLVVAAAAVLASDALDPDEFLALDRALRAALATAKETP
jgi:hypothetical protein